MRLQNAVIISNNTDFGAPWFSDAIPIFYAAGYSIQLAWNGNASGVLKLQCSAASKDDKEPPIWSDIEHSEIMIMATGDHTWNVRESFYTWARVVWTPVSGTSTLYYARFAAKGM